MKKITMNHCRGFLATTLVATLIAGCASKPDAIARAGDAEKDRPSFAETRAIAEEGFVYGLPIVMNYAVMYAFAVDRGSSEYKAPFNQISNEARVFTYEDTTVVTPNSDTPYSMVSLDLRAEPVVLSVPAVEPGRYYSVMLCDGNTFNYGYIGSRATGHDSGHYLVAGPDWQGAVPPGIRKVFRSGTQFSLAIYRTQLFSPADMPNVVKVQAGYQVQPLSAFLGLPAPPAAAAVEFPKIDKDSVKSGFFDYLDFALQFAPPGPEEAAIRARLARIGIGAGKLFNFRELSLAHRAEVALGMKAGEAKVEAIVAAAGKSLNGWRIGGLAGGDRAYFNGNWLERAGLAKAGIYANDPAEAMYPMTRTDTDGEALDGSQHQYTLTFAAGQLPPVNAFWSVTMYDGKSQLLIKNPIDRYLINSPMLPGMKKNDDGSLTIYIQKDSPGAAKQANWLPAPDGPIYLVMRLYWPRTEAPSILPPGAGTWTPPGVARVK